MRFHNSRRTRMVAVTAGVVGVLAACGTGAAPAAAPVGAPQPGGVLRLAIGDEPECLDPQQSPTAAARLLARPLVDSLVAQAPDGTIGPWLATAWTVSPDGLAYTFTLRDDVTFHDGTPFDAAAVVANLDRVVAPDTASLLASSLISAYDSASAADARTVEVRLERPDSTFLSALATPNLGIQSTATLTAPPAERCATVVGTGPFVSEAGFTSQVGIDYERNPAYAWPPAGAAHEGPALLEAVQVQVAPDDSARLGALTSGQVDAVTAVSPTGARELGNAAGFTLYSTPYPGINYSYFPNTASGPFADVRVRTAFRTGIDWAQIVQNVYFGAYQPARGVLTPATPGYDPQLETRYAFDAAAANSLLDEAGWSARDAAGFRTKDGQRLVVRHMWSDPSISDLATQVQTAAKQLGIETKEENLDGGTFVERLLAGDYDLIDTSFAAPGPNVLQVLFDSANIPTPERGISNNMSRYDVPEVQAAFEQALAAPDQASQFAVWRQVQQRITDDAAVFPIYSDQATVATSDRVQGVAFLNDGAFDLYRTWLS